MVIFFGDGRLGNQLFQFAFIKNFLKKKESILTCNFRELLTLFDVKDHILNIDNRFVIFFINKVVVRFLKILSLLRILSFCKANKDRKGNLSREGSGYILKRGLLPILFISPGYYQSEKFFKKENLKDLEIKFQYKKEAEEIINKIPKGKKRIFVHIRRRDYKDINHWFLGRHNFTLPLSYYQKSIKQIEEKIDNPFYIFLSDDVNFVKEKFKDIEPKIVSENSMFIDFTLMTLCDGGILSNSSFSWWGAYFIKNKDLIFVPKDWLGFNNNFVHPVGIYPKSSQIINFKK